ncbi:protein STICHEL-like 2 isoform X1 [Ananas comosus]|uniref:Protein STICHEL-like 2 isoform X1 n=1 Tax=Ananas comosus TaxID=4615 RepID=A0A6P5F704_ANACO|nr:protein STICHEL-like 2 isoform X1 [Ananas comosus]XP_020089030.1 protein STICHEL-like 2 isoform X1 [Ananas comosus]XP_020089035.1 protein STICHEL-like 2 isoform X1 [Ananas comosus]
MYEARRHSVDIPISRTLVALMRSRSLRDPETNSLDKYAALVDTAKSGASSRADRIPESNTCNRRTFSYSQSDLLERRREVLGDAKITGFAKITGSDARPKGNCGFHSARHFGNGFDFHDESNYRLVEQVSSLMLNRSGDGKMRKQSAMREDVHPSHAEISASGGEGCVDDANTFSSNCKVHAAFCSLSRASRRTDTLLPLDERREHPFGEIAQHLDNPRSLSQKYRPRSFAQLVGQNVVAQSLSSAISSRKVAPLYLFHGPRGTGKTSAAKIFAAALNCLSSEERRPCGFCEECALILFGRSRDVKELDATNMNHRASVTIFMSASLDPVPSRFKVFIIEECQFLERETWFSICSNLEKFPQHTVFVMVTSEVEKLPSSCVTWCQRYNFLKISEADIVSRLRKICKEEGLAFEEDALDLLANKANGSLQDAEVMLDQLSLLGQRITKSIAFELIGDVSDDELLDLLDSAFSSDAAATVKKARELMSSKIDPVQLLSQLANLIMDTVARRFQDGESEVGECLGRHDFGKVGMPRLTRALEILSETEKQLQTTKNKSTWLTAALLQFNTEESFPLRDSCDSCADDGLVSTVSAEDNFGNSCHVCGHDNVNVLDKKCENVEALEQIWRRAIEKWPSSSTKSFLLKDGKLSSIYANEGLTIAEVEFCCPEYVVMAEKLREQIVGSLQDVLRCNADVRINLVPTSESKTTKSKKQSFRLPDSSGRKQERSDAGIKVDALKISNKEEEVAGVCSRYHKECPSTVMHQFDVNSVPFFHDKESAAVENVELNTPCTGTVCNKSVQDNVPEGQNQRRHPVSQSREEDEEVSLQEPGNQPSCFQNLLMHQRRFFSYTAACAKCPKIQPHCKVKFSFPRKPSIGACHCIKKPCHICSKSQAQVAYSHDGVNRQSKTPRFGSKLCCWRSRKSTEKVFFAVQNLHLHLQVLEKYGSKQSEQHHWS